MKRILLVLLLFLSSSCLGGEKKKDPDDDPFFAGGLLAFAGEGAAAGSFALQPYFLATRQRGFYDGSSDLLKNLNTHQYSLELVGYYGINSKIDVELGATLVYSSNDGRGSFQFGDTDLFLGFLILEEQKDSWVPNIRFVLGERFPTGRFQNLDPLLNGSDGLGVGSYETSIIFVTSKIFRLCKKHPIRLTFNAAFVQSSSTFVEDFSIFGGGMGTFGKVRPGSTLIGDFAFEYKFNKPWGFVIELYYDHQDRTAFQTQGGTNPIPSIPSNENFSLAPLIEYNFSHKTSATTGVWFSVYGRNTIAFTSWFSTIYYEF